MYNEIQKMCNYIKWLTFLHLINGVYVTWWTPYIIICKEQIQLLLYMDLQNKTNFWWLMSEHLLVEWMKRVYQWHIMHFQATSPRDCFEEALYGCLALVYTHRVTKVYTPHLVLPCSQYQTDQYRPTVTHKANMKMVWSVERYGKSWQP